MAISVVCTLGKKAAVVVHKDFLLSQWRERLALFAPGARVGVVQGDRCEVEGFDVVLCMVHSLVQRAGSGAYPLGAFGLVVFDETHHMAARTFSRAAGLFQARCRLGLTATPDRADGLGYAVEWIVGPVVCEVRRRVARARLSVIRRGKAARYKNVFDRCGNLSFAGMVTQLVEDDARNREVAALVSRMARKPGRCVLVASGRRAHLARLQELVDALLEGSGVRTGQYVGETTKGGKAAREANGEECGVLFTTFGMGEEGLDIPRMNTLVLASPKREVEQLVGRITRKRHGEGGGPSRWCAILWTSTRFLRACTAGGQNFTAEAACSHQNQTTANPKNMHETEQFILNKINKTYIYHNLRCVSFSRIGPKWGP